MRRLIPFLAALTLAAGALAASPTFMSRLDSTGPLAQVDIGGSGGTVISDNVLYLGTLANESPSIGSEVVHLDGETRLVTTGAKGLSIYDVTNPLTPMLLGNLPLPHFQNESVSVSDDGSIALISTDTVAAGTGGVGNGVRIIDISDPTAPTELGNTGGSSHTAMCATADCTWIYGSNGNIYDATDPTSPEQVGKWKPGGGGGHALFRDASGLVISDSTPRYVLDPREDPANPAVLTSGEVPFRFRPDGLLQHNSYRPGADEWVPRRDPAEFPEDALVDDAEGRAADLRPGELLVGTSESNINLSCSNAGGLSTWDMRNFDQGRPMEMMEVFRPFQGTYVDGNPAINALGCSAHWFDVKDGMIVAGWYEHGIRFFDVDLTNGKLTQKGFFQPVATQAGSAHFVGTVDLPELGTAEIIYSTDYARGIDILAYFPDAPAPSQEQFDASWLANAGQRMFIPHRDLHGTGGDYRNAHVHADGTVELHG